MATSKTQVSVLSPQFGCDPEFFLVKNGVVVPSSELIPTNGINGGDGTIVRDGIQGEFTVAPTTCRANLSNSISRVLQVLRAHASSAQINVSFKTSTVIPPKRFATLDPDVRRLGCMPSMNVYDEKADIGVNPETYRRRSCGGHIHMGGTTAFTNTTFRTGNDTAGYKITPYGAELIKILDFVVGNTCVLIDRDPDAAKRRKVYGRAGEFRLPKHGVEYRTLSNFWMHNYTLMSFVMGMCRLAASLWNTKPSREALMAVFDEKKVRKAINTNDLALAQENFELFAGVLEQFVMPTDSSLTWQKLAAFRKFVAEVQEKGLAHLFPEDPLVHWTTKPEGHAKGGWEKWLMDNYDSRIMMDLFNQEFNKHYRAK